MLEGFANYDSLETREEREKINKIIEEVNKLLEWKKWIEKRLSAWKSRIENGLVKIPWIVDLDREIWG